MCIVLLPPGVNPAAVKLISFMGTLSPQAYDVLLLHHNQSIISSRHRGWEIIIIIIINIVIICYYLLLHLCKVFTITRTYLKQTMFLGYTT